MSKNYEQYKKLSFFLYIDGGASRDRTGDLLHAMQALSQLSYSPLLLICNIFYRFFESVNNVFSIQ